MEAEIDAGRNQNGKAIQGLHIFMGDIGVPFDGPIPVAEDNAATCTIAHTGKLICNIRHIALKMLSLQALVRELLTLFRAIGDAQNKADHFTKCLVLPAVREHSAPILWAFDLIPLNMLPSLVVSELKLKPLKRKSSYLSVRGGDVTNQLSHDSVSSTYQLLDVSD
jgi:hypothetical protein